MLGNIRPAYRSTLSSIQLLSLVEVPVLEKYGHDAILKPVIKDIKKLEEVRFSVFMQIRIAIPCNARI